VRAERGDFQTLPSSTAASAFQVAPAAALSGAVNGVDGVKGCAPEPAGVFGGDACLEIVCVEEGTRAGKEEGGAQRMEGCAAL